MNAKIDWYLRRLKEKRDYHEERAREYDNKIKEYLNAE